jgi:hypothetical protein
MINIIDDVLLIIGAFIILIWGVAHVFPVRSVVRGFGDISNDNRRIIIMEWLSEGLTLCFIGALVLVMVMFAGTENDTADIVYWAASIMLLVMAVLTLATGARTSIIPIKICPLIKTIVAVLFILALTTFA